MVNSQSSSEHILLFYFNLATIFLAWCSSSIKFFKLSIKKIIDSLNNYQF